VGVDRDHDDLARRDGHVAVGPDFKTFDVAGNNTIIPSGLGIAFFALFATIAVAKYGFDRRRET